MEHTVEHIPCRCIIARPTSKRLPNGSVPNGEDQRAPAFATMRDAQQGALTDCHFERASNWRQRFNVIFNIDILIISLPYAVRVCCMKAWAVRSAPKLYRSNSVKWVNSQEVLIKKRTGGEAFLRSARSLMLVNSYKERTQWTVHWYVRRGAILSPSVTQSWQRRAAL